MSYASGREEIRHPRPHDDLIERVVRWPDLSAGSTRMVRTAAWWRVGPWREDIRRYEDYEWFLRFALGGLRLVISPVVGARVHSNDRSGLDLAQAEVSTARILELHGEELRRRSPRAERALRATFEQELAWAAWRSRRHRKFLLHLGRAIRVDPTTRSQVLVRAALARLRWRATHQPVDR
jgi:hypothetical protein